jgi:hypothetical protein
LSIISAFVLASFTWSGGIKSCTYDTIDSGDLRVGSELVFREVCVTNTIGSAGSLVRGNRFVSERRSRFFGSGLFSLRWALVGSVRVLFPDLA